MQEGEGVAEKFGEVTEKLEEDARCAPPGWENFENFRRLPALSTQLPQLSTELPRAWGALASMQEHEGAA